MEKKDKHGSKSLLLFQKPKPIFVIKNTENRKDSTNPIKNLEQNISYNINKNK